jgi:thioredoxin 1
MGTAMDVNDSNFDAEVLKSDKPVLVDFWATWCNPCKMLSPIIDKLSVEYAGRIKMAKVDVDNSTVTASSQGIRSLPTIIFYKGGAVSEQIIGVVSEVQLKKVIDKVLA